jgi:hypothetical protein
LAAQLRSRPKADRKRVGAAIDAIADNWGKPHLHSGIGIRRLRGDLFEARIGLDERLAFVFIATPAELFFLFLGNHDEIQDLMKGWR